MPLFEFICDDCGELYEEMTSYDAKGIYEGVQCPHCQSANKHKQVSTCTCIFNQPEGTDLWRNSHDYRFRTKLPKAQEEREKAKAKALTKNGLMSANPYGATEN